MSWGFSMGAHKHKTFSYIRPSVNYEIVMAVLFPPGALFATFVVDGIEYWSWKPITKEQRWVNFQKRFGDGYKTREQFDEDYA